MVCLAPNPYSETTYFMRHITGTYLHWIQGRYDIWNGGQGHIISDADGGDCVFFKRFSTCFAKEQIVRRQSRVVFS
jgi:hypothetical protein